MQRRASLSISTNAIVVLIIAVVMLGLIMGLVTKSFGAVEKKFLTEIENQEREPANPSPSTPITLSSYSLIAEPGQLAGFKAKIWNSESDKAFFVPIIYCLGDGDDDATWKFPPSKMQVFPAELDEDQVGEYTVIAELSSSATEETTLCQVRAWKNDNEEPMAGTGWEVSDIKGTEIKLTIED